jgi:hypothetical protein
MGAAEMGGWCDCVKRARGVGSSPIRARASPDYCAHHRALDSMKDRSEHAGDAFGEETREPIIVWRERDLPKKLEQKNRS